MFLFCFAGPNRRSQLFHMPKRVGSDVILNGFLIIRVFRSDAMPKSLSLSLAVGGVRRTELSPAAIEYQAFLRIGISRSDRHHERPLLPATAHQPAADFPVSNIPIPARPLPIAYATGTVDSALTTQDSDNRCGLDWRFLSFTLRGTWLRRHDL